MGVLPEGQHGQLHLVATGSRIEGHIEQVLRGGLPGLGVCLSRQVSRVEDQLLLAREHKLVKVLCRLLVNRTHIDRQVCLIFG